jgi:SAM-dependent methyltransferase
MARVSLIKRMYRTLPLSIRHSRIMRRAQTFAQSYLLPHNWVYDADYYDRMVEAPARRSAPIMAGTIVRDLRPKRVIDVGCGTGALLDALRDLGCEVAGLEHSDAALEYCRSRALAVRQFDLEQDSISEGDDKKWDVVISMEVAEHLPQSVDERYVELLASLGPVIVFTAATPGQGGHDHINEQPHEYWLEKFGRRGLVRNAELSERWRREWQAAEHVQDWYCRNIMVLEQQPA